MNTRNEHARKCPEDDCVRRQGRSSESQDKPGVAEWQLRLYVAGQAAKSIAALGNLQRM
jgi:hypothetical protein